MRDIQRGRQRGMGTGRRDDDSRWEQQGRSPRSRRPDDDMRQSRMGSRGGRDDARGGGGGGGGYDRPPRNGARYPRRDVEENWDDGGRGGSSGRGGRPAGPPRGNWDDPRGSRGGPPDRSGDRSGDRSMRGGRPPVREDWDAPSRGRGGPGYSGTSRRPPQGGGLWGDEDRGPRGRPGMGGPAGMRDPRMARGGRGMPPPEPEKGQLSFSKGLGIVAGMFVLGIAVAFGFFMLTRPNPQLNDTPPAPTNTTAPDLTPTVAPNITPSPSGRAPGAGPAFVFVFAGARQ